MKSYYNTQTLKMVKGTTILEDILESSEKTAKLLACLNAHSLAINSSARLNDKKTSWIVKQGN